MIPKGELHSAHGRRRTELFNPGVSLTPGRGTCSWNITVSPGEFVKLTFWKFDGPCKKNYAEVVDTKTVLGKFCARTDENEQVVYSTGNNVLVKYSSLFSAYLEGFVATYETLKAIPARYACSIGGYDSVLKGLSGEFASFDYPFLYPNDASCTWKIEVPVGYVVQLTFHAFGLQQSQDCQADYIEIRHSEEDYDWRHKLIGRFCGFSLPGVIRSNYTYMHVDFVTDSSGRYPGFHASFKAVPDRE
ncbi:Bone morphogenetic protein 1 [Desmophyllum pertusum]|uniref:Bone morphogenetic protein 1 n=1 Tax=Desmophyllum pertusum TaxID=174260 RepID=A0A9W9ZXU8_9CNID|nr:Bone morphogenetic protein 1 [Desmophyllum pertusum]